MTRKLYLAVFAALVIVLTIGALYLKHRTAKAAADCDTPAAAAATQPPPPANLPGFALEAGCGTGAESASGAKGAGKKERSGAQMKKKQS
jgi:uncharacterized membrane protein